MPAAAAAAGRQQRAAGGRGRASLADFVAALALLASGGSRLFWRPQERERLGCKFKFAHKPPSGRCGCGEPSRPAGKRAGGRARVHRFGGRDRRKLRAELRGSGRPAGSARSWPAGVSRAHVMRILAGARRVRAPAARWPSKWLASGQPARPFLARRRDARTRSGLSQRKAASGLKLTCACSFN